MNPQIKQKTNRDKKYLEWLKTLPCVACGRYPIEGVLQVVPAHSGGGMALKGDDFDSLPLCVDDHTGKPCAFWFNEHQRPAMFWLYVEDNTGKTREQHVREHQERWSKSNG